MLKTIKTGKEIGVAIPVQGLTVDATKDQYGTWHYIANDINWSASDYAFIDETLDLF